MATKCQAKKANGKKENRALSAIVAGAPFFGGDLPKLRGQASADVIAFLGGDPAHALFFRDSLGSHVLNGFGGAEDGKLQSFKPELGDGVAGFAHQALPLPGQAEPEAAIVVFLGA